ncbi:hypothetical protein SDC9_126188 [bioreactor metagenome]|uniref:Uncharacterized protein n=1 Tax=bioreactor metagenome TaxID=1076179 RepID=A0A645CQH9_9ZZZZ
MLQLHVRRAGEGFHLLLNQLAGLLQHGHVFAEQFHRHVAAHSGNQFVEAHLNRLGEFVIVAGNVLQRFFHFGDKRGFRLFRIRPFLARFQDGKAIGHAGRHGVGGNFRRAKFGEDIFHLGEFLQAAFQRVLHFDGLRQARAGNAERV